MELGFSSTRETFRSRKRAHPFAAGVGALLMGALAGLITRLIWPVPIFDPGPVRGLSLLISPLLTGLLMHQYGEWREAHGKTRTFLSTFSGGALFAFAMALVRLLLVLPR